MKLRFKAWLILNLEDQGLAGSEAWGSGLGWIWIGLGVPWCKNRSWVWVNLKLEDQDLLDVILEDEGLAGSKNSGLSFTQSLAPFTQHIETIYFRAKKLKTIKQENHWFWVGRPSARSLRRKILFWVFFCSFFTKKEKPFSPSESMRFLLRFYKNERCLGFRV